MKYSVSLPEKVSKLCQLKLSPDHKFFISRWDFVVNNMTFILKLVKEANRICKPLPMYAFKSGGGGSIIGLHAKKGGGPALGPMLKSLQRGPKGGGPDLLDPRQIILPYDCYTLE